MENDVKNNPRDKVISEIYHAISRRFKYVEFGHDFLIVANGKEKYQIKITKKN